MITMIISVVNTKLLFVSKKVTIKTGITKKPEIAKIGKSELKFSIFYRTESGLVVIMIVSL